MTILIRDLNYIKKLLFRFKNKIIIVNKKNLGVAKSRNIASRHVEGNILLI